MAPTRQINPADLPEDLHQAPDNATPDGPESIVVAGASPSQPAVLPTKTLGNNWTDLLTAHVEQRLADQTSSSTGSKLMLELTREFESAVLLTTLRATNGRRVDAAARLGVGRNTVTRKIQELDLDA